MEQNNQDIYRNDNLNDVCDTTTSYQENYYQDYTAQYMNSHANPVMYGNDSSQDGSGEGFAIASLVLGIISILTCCCCLLGLLLGILGLIFALVSKKGKTWDGMIIAGLICSIVGMVLSLGFMIRMMIPMLILRSLKNFF